MKIPAVWLREFVPVPENPNELEAFCDMLTLAGLEVEEVLTSGVGPTLYTKITPNRGDWASVYGTAREAAAAGKLPLVPLPVAPFIGAGEAGAFASITVLDAENCPRYGAKIIRGVRIGPTPAWMQARLTAALGDKYKSINNVVDITNYVMLELGQPLHAFDLATVPGGQIVVRQAEPGEKITTLDGVERILPPGTLCICDANKPIAIAGIMGGAETEITSGTTDILLESAHFNPFSIRRTAKKLPLATEASYRFERFVDLNLVPIAAERAAQLIAQYAGGTVARGMVEAMSIKTPPTRIVARVERIRKLLGADVDRDVMIAGLERLGLSVERSAGALDVVVPAWRPDLTMEDDIAEEVGRIALGYENLPETIPPVLSPGTDSALGLFTSRVRETLVRAGMQDVLSHSLVAPSDLATPEEAAHRVMVRSALSPELSSLRTSLLPNLLAIVSRGFAGGLRDIAVFEVGPVYRTSKNGSGYEEPLHISGVVTGSAMPPAWALKGDALPMDFYFVKGVVEDLLRALHIDGAAFAPDTHPITHPNRTASVSVGDVPLGFVAELSEVVVDAHNLPRRTYVFELDGDALRRLSEGRNAQFTPLSRFPSVVRDLAPVFPVSVSYADVERVARQFAPPILENLRLADVYDGANVGVGNRSLTLRFTFRSFDKSLKEADVEAALSPVRAALTTELGADFRGT